MLSHRPVVRVNDPCDTLIICVNPPAEFHAPDPGSSDQGPGTSEPGVVQAAVQGVETSPFGGAFRRSEKFLRKFSGGLEIRNDEKGRNKQSSENRRLRHPGAGFSAR